MTPLVKKTPAPSMRPCTLVFHASLPVCHLLACDRFYKCISCTYRIPHGSSTGHVHTGVVGPLDVVDGGAILEVVGSVEEVIIVAHKPNGTLPFPSLLSPVGVCL